MFFTVSDLIPVDATLFDPRAPASFYSLFQLYYHFPFLHEALHQQF